MRIAYIVPSLEDTSGWGRWSNDFLRSISAAGVKPVIWAPSQAKIFYDALNPDWEVHFSLPQLFDYFQSREGVVNFFLSATKLIKSFKNAHNIQLVHSLDAHPWGLYGHFLSQKLSVPHILTTHGRYGYIAENRMMDRWLYHKVLGHASKMIAVSEVLKNSILDACDGNISKEKVIAVQNPVDADSFLVKGELIKKCDDVPTIVSVTRFVPVKDIETAVMAFKAVKEKIPDARYYIIGPGTGDNNYYFKKIKQLIDDESVEGISIVGKVSKEQLVSYYKKSSILLHTAMRMSDDYESSGLILLEAGLFGLPVVASRSGGIPEVVEHNVTGILAAERDVAGHADAMLRLLKDKELAKVFGENNKRRALERNWDNYICEQKRIYAEIV